ncbi:MAG: hypothetical protein IPP78_16195 [Holophagaceae bacterium]|nr:hypothetical protein [Holophagaceae bacterium]
MVRCLLALLFMVTLPLAGGSREWTPERWFEQPKSARVANYRIQASLDWVAKTLEGRETISWRNVGTAPTAEFPLHLYLNAFKGPQSLFQREGGSEIRGVGSNASTWGYCRLLGVRLNGQELQGHFGEDETVYWVRLPKAVAPGKPFRWMLRGRAASPRPRPAAAGVAFS